MPPLCPECGWVLTKMELLNHTYYNCWNTEFHGSGYHQKMWKLYGDDTWFNCDELPVDVKSEREQLPTCSGASEMQPACYSGCTWYRDGECKKEGEA